MSWKSWKRGLLIALLTGLCTGTIALGAGASWRVSLYLIAGTVAKDVLLYLNKNPQESITDTTIIPKPPNEKTPSS